ncbi:Protein ATS1 [Candida viswanathii]|uniref:Protein ATS1 n=1 Tax=Candida viswanathii TaxID=5486 RepID=A0A367YKK8_9ASCO|nr:Protein ATS1 [Candida viswanathii]
MYRLLACGSNGNYQLALGHDDDLSTLQASIFSIDDKPTTTVPGRPTKIACGGNHTLVLVDSGEVYACGSNEFGQCGLPKCDNLKVFTHIPGDDWIDVACGWEFSVLVNRANEIYVCGNGPKGELGLGKEKKQTELAYCTTQDNFKRVKSCMQHTIVETTQGELIGWGNARKGQLGEASEKILWVPTTLNFDVPVDDFSLGREFTAVQSGLDKVKIYGKFSVTLDDNLLPTQAAVSRMETMWSSVHLLSNKTIESYGNNSHDQLFPTSDTTPVEEFSIGSEHGLVKSGNMVYAWGWSEHGNCGKPENEKQTFDYLNTLYTGQDKVVLIGTGCATSWIVVEVQ